MEPFLFWEDTTMEHENISKPVQEQNVDLVDDTILTNTTVTFGQRSIDNCPEFYDLSSSIQMKPNNAQIQRDEFTPIEIVGVKYQSFAENVVSLFPNSTPIIFPPKFKKDDAIHVEDDENKGTTPEYCLTSIDNNKAEVEYENLFNFLISNEREERTHTVECIRIHDNSKAYGGQSIWFA